VTETLLLLLGISIIVVLSVIAWRLQNKVRNIERQRQQQQEELEKSKREHQEYIQNSIHILAQGLVDDQLALTEGAIRISVMISNLENGEAHKEEFSAFFQLADATAHIPILDSWKQLPKKDKFRLDKERLQIEDKFRDFILDAAKRASARKSWR
jgi:hypothetical protein